MKVKLILSVKKVKCLKYHLGENNVTTIGEPDKDGYITTLFEIRNHFDVLSIIHAGQDHGLAIGLGKDI